MANAVQVQFSASIRDLIDATDRECQRILVESLDALNRREEADRLRKVFGL